VETNSHYLAWHRGRPKLA